MSVENIQQSQEQQVNEYKQRESEREDFVKALSDSGVIKSLNLAADLPVQEEQVEDSQEEQAELVEQQDLKDEDNQSQDIEQDQDEEDELIPKSKIQPRIDKFKAEAEYWKNKYNNQAESKPKNTDDVSERLENMSESDLEVLKDQARDAWLEAKIKGDANLAQQYRDLEKKADKAISTAPQRFNQKQVDYYNRIAQEISVGNDFKDSDVQEILKIAREIYSGEKGLHNMVEGQGLALKAAVREYKNISKLSLKAKETPKLKSQLNTLKKVTALDSRNIKASQNENTIVSSLLRKSKNTGLSAKEKTTLIGNDPRFGIDALIPSDLRG